MTEGVAAKKQPAPAVATTGGGGGGALSHALHERVLAPLVCASFVGAILASTLLCNAAVAAVLLWPRWAPGWTLLALMVRS
jgi:hypothetical protein